MTTKRLLPLLLALTGSIILHAAGSIPEDGSAGSTALITIDGDFTDWHFVASDRLAELSLHEEAAIGGLYAVKFCADSSFLYFYFEFSPEVFEMEGDSGTTVRGNRVETFDIMMDTDCNGSTGYDYSYQWSNSGADILLEGKWTDSFAGTEAFIYTGEGSDRQQWTWGTIEISRPALSCQRVILNDGQAAVEGRITRSLLSDTLSVVRVGVAAYNTQWTLTGVLPQQVIDPTQGQITYPRMLEVPLTYDSNLQPDTTVITPDTTVLTPIAPSGMCGDSVAWILEERVLTISGSGQMWHYSEETYPDYAGLQQMIQKIVVQQGVTNIGDYAFTGFMNLTEVVILGDIESIGISAFSGCSSLTSITCYSATPPSIAGNMVFNEVPSSVNIYVPASSLEQYKASRGWSVFANLQAMEQEIVVTIFGLDIEIPDSAATGDFDLLGDSTLLYNRDENTLTFNGLTMEVGEEESTAIRYSGSEPLTIVLNDTSTIYADTVIVSQSDIIITGEGTLVAEGVVPLLGVPTATITFDSVSMYVKSLPSAAAVRRRIRGVKALDEDGGPALSGFASADFNKTDITPPDADYGEVEVDEGAGIPSSTIFALYVINAEGQKTPLTEFTLTARADALNAIDNTRTTDAFDTQQPMYNILGMPVGEGYKGIVIQNGRTFIVM